MDVCRSGMKCESVGVVALAEDARREAVHARVKAELAPLTQCWRLRDEITNHKFLRNASGLLTGGGAIGTGLWAATHNGDAQIKGLEVGGGVTLLGVAGLAHQTYNISAAEKAFLNNRCAELIENNARAGRRVLSSGSQSHFSSMPQQAEALLEGAMGRFLTGELKWLVGSDGSYHPVVIHRNPDGKMTEVPSKADQWVDGTADWSDWKIKGSSSVPEGTSAFIMEVGGGFEVISAAGWPPPRPPRRLDVEDWLTTPGIDMEDVGTPMPEEAVAFGVARVDPCQGADVLIRGCTPVRTIPVVYEFSTDIAEIQRQQMIVGGILVAPAVALYVAAAGVEALAGGSEGLAAAFNAVRLLVAPL